MENIITLKKIKENLDKSNYTISAIANDNSFISANANNELKNFNNLFTDNSQNILEENNENKITENNPDLSSNNLENTKDLIDSKESSPKKTLKKLNEIIKNENQNQNQHHKNSLRQNKLKSSDFDFRTQIEKNKEQYNRQKRISENIKGEKLALLKKATFLAKNKLNKSMSEKPNLKILTLKKWITVNKNKQEQNSLSKPKSNYKNFDFKRLNLSKINPCKSNYNSINSSINSKLNTSNFSEKKRYVNNFEIDMNNSFKNSKFNSHRKKESLLIPPIPRSKERERDSRRNYEKKHHSFSGRESENNDRYNNHRNFSQEKPITIYRTNRDIIPEFNSNTIVVRKMTKNENEENKRYTIETFKGKRSIIPTIKDTFIPLSIPKDKFNSNATKKGMSFNLGSKISTSSTTQVLSTKNKKNNAPIPIPHPHPLPPRKTSMQMNKEDIKSFQKNKFYSNNPNYNNNNNKKDNYLPRKSNIMRKSMEKNSRKNSLNLPSRRIRSKSVTEPKYRTLSENKRFSFNKRVSNFDNNNNNKNKVNPKTKKVNKVNVEKEYEKAFEFYNQLKENFKTCENKFMTTEENNNVNNNKISFGNLYNEEIINEKLVKLSNHNNFLQEYFALLSIFYKSLLQRKEICDKQKKKDFIINRNRNSVIKKEGNKKENLSAKLNQSKKEYNNLLKEYNNLKKEKEKEGALINKNKKTKEIKINESNDFKYDNMSNDMEEYIDKLIFCLENNDNDLDKSFSIDQVNQMIQKISEKSKLSIEIGKKNIHSIRTKEKYIYELNKLYYYLNEQELESFCVNDKDKFNFFKENFGEKNIKSIDLKNITSIDFLKNMNSYDNNNQEIIIQKYKSLPPLKKKETNDYNFENNNKQSFNKSFSSPLKNSFFDDKEKNNNERNTYIINFNINMNKTTNNIIIQKDNEYNKNFNFKKTKKKPQAKKRKNKDHKGESEIEIDSDISNEKMKNTFDNENSVNSESDLNETNKPEEEERERESHIDILKMYKNLGTEMSNVNLGKLNNYSSNERLFTKKNKLSNSNFYRSQILLASDPEKFSKRKKNKMKSVESIKKFLNNTTSEQDYVDNDLDYLNFYAENQEVDMDSDFYLHN